MLPRTRENELRQILKDLRGEKNMQEVYITNQEELTRNQRIREELEKWIDENSKNLSIPKLGNLVNEFTTWFERHIKNLHEDAYYFHPYNAAIRTFDGIERSRLVAQRDKQDLEALKKKWANPSLSDQHIQQRLAISSSKEQKSMHPRVYKIDDTLSRELNAWFEQHKQHLPAKAGASYQERKQSNLRLQEDKKALQTLIKRWSTPKLEAASVHSSSRSSLTYKR